MGYALASAETGHLCLATLHSNNANQTLDRITGFFPAEMHQQLWMGLSLNLRLIVAQQLVPTIDQKKRIPAVEILINTPAVAESIRKNELDTLRDFMTRSNEQGMQTYDQALFHLYVKGMISYETALKYAESENEVRLMIKLNKGVSRGEGGNFSIL
jgi:twitching motility protein PilU